MKKLRTRVLSWALTLAMLFSMLPISARAADNDVLSSIELSVDTSGNAVVTLNAAKDFNNMVSVVVLPAFGFNQYKNILYGWSSGAVTKDSFASGTMSSLASYVDSGLPSMLYAQTLTQESNSIKSTGGTFSYTTIKNAVGSNKIYNNTGELSDQSKYPFVAYVMIGGTTQFFTSPIFYVSDPTQSDAELTASPNSISVETTAGGIGGIVSSADQTQTITFTNKNGAVDAYIAKVEMGVDFTDLGISATGFQWIGDDEGNTTPTIIAAGESKNLTISIPAELAGTIDSSIFVYYYPNYTGAPTIMECIEIPVKISIDGLPRMNLSPNPATVSIEKGNLATITVTLSVADASAMFLGGSLMVTDLSGPSGSGDPATVETTIGGLDIANESDTVIIGPEEEKSSAELVFIIPAAQLSEVGTYTLSYNVMDLNSSLFTNGTAIITVTEGTPTPSIGAITIANNNNSGNGAASGKAYADDVLTVSAKDSTSANISSGDLDYAWTVGGVAVSGNNSPTYTVQSADELKTIMVTVTPKTSSYTGSGTASVDVLKAASYSFAVSPATYTPAGTVYEGYTASTYAQTVTITNNGDALAGLSVAATSGGADFDLVTTGMSATLADGSTTPTSTTFTVTPKSSLSVGTHTGVFTISTTSTSDTKTFTYTFTVSAKAATKIVLSSTSGTYTGLDLTPAGVAVKNQAETVTIPNGDYDGVWTKNGDASWTVATDGGLVNVGTYTYTVTLKGNSAEAYNNPGTATFTITKKAAAAAPGLTPTSPTTSGGTDGSIKITSNYDGAKAYEYSTDGGSTWHDWTTDSDTQSGLGAGSYIVRAKYDAANEEPSGQGTTTLANPTAFPVTIAVTKDGGYFAENTAVTLKGASDYSGTLDATGHAVISNVPNGTYTIEVAGGTGTKSVTVSGGPTSESLAFYTLTVNAGTNGSLPTGGGVYIDGKTVVVGASSNTGWEFAATPWVVTSGTDTTVSGFTVTVKNTATVTAQYTAIPVTIITSSLTSVVYGNTSYTATIAAGGGAGAGTYTYTLTNAAALPWLALNASTGALTINSATADVGTYTLKVTASSTNGAISPETELTLDVTTAQVTVNVTSTAYSVAKDTTPKLTDIPDDSVITATAKAADGTTLTNTFNETGSGAGALGGTWSIETASYGAGAQNLILKFTPTSANYTASTGNVPYTGVGQNPEITMNSGTSADPTGTGTSHAESVTYGYDASGVLTYYVRFKNTGNMDLSNFTVTETGNTDKFDITGLVTTATTLAQGDYVEVAIKAKTGADANAAPYSVVITAQSGTTTKAYTANLTVNKKTLVPTIDLSSLTAPTTLGGSDGHAAISNYSDFNVGTFTFSTTPSGGTDTSGTIGGLSAGSYTVTATPIGTTADNYAAGTSASFTIPAGKLYTGTVTVRVDGTATSAGITGVALKSSVNATYDKSQTVGSSGVYTFTDNLSTDGGTYTVWVNGVNTNKTLTSVNQAETVDFYTVSVAAGTGAENVGVVPSNGIVLAGQTATLSSAAKAGYTGSVTWTLSGGSTSSVSGDIITVNDTVTATASYALETYTVTYRPGTLGTGSQTTDAKTHGVNLTLKGATFTRTGYTQTGWATSDGGAQVYALSGTYTGNTALTLYPVWTTNTYTVTYSGNGSTSGSTANSSHTYDVAQNLTANGYVKTGYTFAGWDTDPSGANVVYTDGQSVTNLAASGTVTLYAVWTANTYTVAYDGKDATSGSTANSSHTYDVAQNLTANGYVKTGYTFAGWDTDPSGANVVYTDGQSVTNLAASGTVTLYAVWTANTYTVAYDGKDATSGSTANSSHTYDVAQNLTANGYVKTGYTFAGWDTDPSGANVVYTDGQSVTNLAASGTVTLYAVWTANTYTVAYDGKDATSGSTANSSHTYDVAQNLTANGYVKTGYTFAGWDTDPSGANVVYTDGQSVTNLAASGTVTLYAVWTANTYTVAYDGKDATSGSTANSSHTYDVAQNLTANGYVKTGYTFAGWDTDPSGANVVYTDGQSVTNLAASGTVTLYAVWTANTYTVAYDGKDATSGSTANSSHTYDVAQNLTANGYVKTGYTFAGWDTDPSGANVVYTDGQSVTNLAASGTVTLYAVWTANTYTVAYDGKDATSGSTANSSHTYDVAQNLTANGYVKTGYTFAGWDTDPSGANVVYTDGQSVTNLAASGTVTLYAVWTANTYTVAYDGKDATSGSTANSSHTYDVAQNLTANGYVKTGYTFAGWDTDPSGANVVYTDGQSVTNLAASGTVTLYAVWTANTYTVAYDGKDATSGSTANSSHTYDVAQNLTANGYVKTGYTFAGWDTDPSGANVVYTDGQSVTNLAASGTVTLYAVWTANTYTVAYDGKDATSGSTANSSHTYDVAQNLTANGYVKTGYTFAGWDTDPSGANVVYTDGQSVTNLAASGTVTLYAVWTANTYTVAYDGKDATSGSTANSSHTYDVAQNLTANGYVKTGYTFAGWDTDPSGANVVYTDGQSVTNLAASGTVTLYAVWTANTYTVAYDGKDATSGSTANSSHTYDVAQNLTANGYVKTGYTFAGWDTDPSGANVVYTDGQSVTNLAASGTVTLYAVWTANTYTVAYDGKDATSGSTANSSHTYDVAQNLTANGYVKTGYTFAGWDTDPSGANVVYTDGQSVTNLAASGTVTLYAVWTANTYTVAYDGKDATSGSTANSSHTYDVAQNLTANGYVKTGYTFAGWDTDPSGANVVYTDGQSVTNLAASGTVTLYAVWTANTYTVAYDGKDATSGSTANSSHTYDVAQNLTANGYVKTGYTFAGWDTDPSGANVVYTDGQSVTNLAASGTVTLYAVWTANTYTVAYDGKDATSGSTANSSHTYDVAQNLTANGYVKTGYTFAGWDTDPSGANVVYTDGQSVTNLAASGTVTLYAVWTANTYTVAYDGKDATSGSTANSSHTYDVAQNLTANGYVKTGYTFAGWDTDPSGANVVYTDGQSVTNLAASGTVTLYAVWTANTYTVAYDGKDATSGSTANSSHTYDVAQNLTANGYVKTGYTFAGWDTDPSGANVVYTDGQSVTNLAASGTVTLYAVWTANTYTVAYDGKDATSGSTANSSHTYDVAQNLTANGYVKTGYTFAGWDTDPSGANVVYTDGQSVTNLAASGTVTLYAVWTANTYTVAYDGKDATSGSTANSSHTYDVAQNLTANGYVKTGYTFAGWDTDPSGANVVYTDGQSVTNLAASGTVTLYAVWTANTYTVAYDGKDATSGSTANSSHTYDVAQNLTANGYVKTGYTFAGWDTDPSGANVVYTDGQSVTNLAASGTVTLYAVWTANTYTVAYDGKDATSGSTANSSHTYDVAQNLTANGYVKTGYTFAGWDTDPSGANVVYTDGQSVTNLAASGTVTLYAVWTANTYTVAYDGKDATSGSTANSSHTYDVAQNLTANGYVKTGYTFAGWDTDPSGANVVYTDGQSVTNLAASGTVTLYAVWTANTYTVAYDGKDATSGSTANSSHTYDVAQNLTANGYVKTGYTFAGWDTDPSGANVVYTDGQSVTNLAASGTVTLYAVWTANTYTVAYDGKDATSGSTANSSHTYDVAQNLTANGYVKTGYTFAGWDTDPSGANVVYTDGQSVTNLAASGTVTLYAVWTANTYTVAYDGKDATSGSTANSSHTYDVAQNLTANGYVKTGYTFAGWDTDPSGANVVYTDGQSVTNLAASGTVTLYAVWTANTYTVAYDGKDATSGSTANSSHTYDVAQNLTANGYVKTGYTFAGWDTDPSGANVVYTDGQSVTNLAASGTVTLYAVWTANTYTVAYDGKDATSGSTANSSHTYDVAQNLTANGYVKTGYTFAGWDTDPSGANVVYTDGQSVTNLAASGTVTLYAVWTANTYTVAYDGKDATSGSTANSSHTYDVAQNLTANGYVKTGYTFAGWDTDPSGANVVYTDGQSVTNLAASGTVTLYAVWTANTYTVAYDGKDATSGSTANSSHTYDVAQNLTANGYVKTGYTFAGWDTDPSGANVVYTDGQSVTNLAASGTVTLYAVWTANTYTVAYDGKDATSGSTANSSHTYDVAQNLTANGYVKTGYTFAGWDTDPSGANVVYTDGQSVTNLAASGTVTLYAVWTDNSRLSVKDDVSGATFGNPFARTGDTTTTYKISVKNTSAAGITLHNLKMSSVVGSGFDVIDNLTTDPAADSLAVNAELENKIEVKLQDAKKTVPGTYTITITIEGSTTPADSDQGHREITATYTLTVTVPGGGPGPGGGGVTELAVTYDLKGKGTSKDALSETVASGGKPANVPTVTSNRGYTFKGWSQSDPSKTEEPKLVDPKTVVIKADTTFYAVYDEPVTGEHEHYIKGYDTGIFGPADNITRSQVAAIIARACLDGFHEDTDYGNGGYTDVADDHWARSAIAFVTAAGVFEGDGEGHFDPDRPITRQEFALVFARMVGLLEAGEMPFSDAGTTADWAITGVYTAYAKGWVNGYEDGTFKPWNNIARSEAVKIVNRYLGRGVDAEGIKDVYSELKQWPDVPETYWAYYEILEASNDHTYFYVDGTQPPEVYTKAYIEEASWGK
ncbi:exported hypothetical protein [uncultured Eubacteriales bacterium]|uniref:SLH domain-containing protein n=1 Tax=uncultured Eubacteriales bacterium TaxID=172733 RepID=A0A212IW91_9FIRM|nr:exported hypothetical protein [uncultured Eubacteriales bacterium]